MGVPFGVRLLRASRLHFKWWNIPDSVWARRVRGSDDFPDTAYPRQRHQAGNHPISKAKAESRMTRHAGCHEDKHVFNNRNSHMIQTGCGQNGFLFFHNSVGAGKPGVVQRVQVAFGAASSASQCEKIPARDGNTSLAVAIQHG
jgi:hypothetical protein